MSLGRGGWATWLGATLILVWVLAALGAPLLAPFSPTATLVPYAPPGATFAGEVLWLGTDHIGRDTLSRILWGARRVLVFAPAATLAAFLVGVPLGLLAGYRGGWIDEIVSRAGDLVLAFPVLVLYIVIISKFGASALNVFVAVVFAAAPGIMRIVRALTLEVRTRAFVAAAELRGEGGAYVALVEILPNLSGPLIVDFCLRLGYVVIAVGVLGFLGLGLPPPDPDWGGMIAETRLAALAFPAMAVFPCIAISSLVLGLNLLADGLSAGARR